MVSDNDNTNSTTNPTNDIPVWTSLLAMADDDEEDDPGDYDEFRSDYDLDDDGVFDNDDIGSDDERFVCMTLSNSWCSPDDEYDDDDILLQHGVFDDGGTPSIHPIFLNGTLNDGLGRPYVHDDPISDTQVFHHALLKSSMRKKRGDVDNSIEYYDALWCKFQQIGIHNSTDYFRIDSSESLQLLLSNFGLEMIYQSTIDSINLELIFA